MMTTKPTTTMPIHVVMGGWVAGNGVLAGVLAAFRPEPISVVLYAVCIAILSAFGLAVLLAVRRDRVGQQLRMPVRGTTAALVALGLTLGGLGLVYGYYLSLVGIYPLVLAAALAGGERLRPRVRPTPVAPDGALPGGRPRAPYEGGSTGTSVPVPPEHAAHGPPDAAPARPVRLVRTAGLAVIAARTVGRLLRGRRR